MTTRTSLLVAATLVVALVGTAFGGTLYDAFVDSAAGFDMSYDQFQGTDYYPTMRADVGPLVGGVHTTDFYVQGHSGVADITLAQVCIRRADQSMDMYTATYGNGGLTTNSEGTLARFIGISVPFDFELVQLRFLYSDNECYDMSVTPGD